MKFVVNWFLKSRRCPGDVPLCYGLCLVGKSVFFEIFFVVFEEEINGIGE